MDPKNRTRKMLRRNYARLMRRLGGLISPMEPRRSARASSGGAWFEPLESRTLLSLTVLGANPVPPIVWAPITNGSTSSSISPSNGTEFGTAYQGATGIAETYTISDPGFDAALKIGSITLPKGFSLTTAPAATLSAGASTTMVVTMPTGNVGTFSGNVSFKSNDPVNNSSFAFAITGAVVALPIKITGANITLPTKQVAIANGSNSTSTGNGTNFGSVAQGTVPVDEIYTITNTSKNPIPFSVNPILPSGFTLVPSEIPEPTMLEPNASTTFEVALDTANIGTFTGILTISAPSSVVIPGNAFTFKITGIVTARRPI